MGGDPGVGVGVTGGDPGAGAHGPLHPQTRRSMVFAKHLRAVGDEFRSRYLNSTDAADRIPFEEDWTKMKVAPTSVILGWGHAFYLFRHLTTNPLIQERAERGTLSVTGLPGPTAPVARGAARQQRAPCPGAGVGTLVSNRSLDGPDQAPHVPPDRHQPVGSSSTRSSWALRWGARTWAST